MKRFEETVESSQRRQDAPPGAEAEPCGPGEETYVGSGLFAWLPAATELEMGSTDDPPPHAEAGATFKLDGEDVEIWRALQYGPDEVPSATGRADHGAAVFVRTNDPARQDCVLAGLRYDSEADTNAGGSELLVDITISDSQLLVISLKNLSASNDVEYASFGSIQRLDTDTWTDVLTAPFGTANQPGRPCDVSEPCDITPDQPILRVGAPAVEYVVQLPDLPAGQYDSRFFPSSMPLRNRGLWTDGTIQRPPHARARTYSRQSQTIQSVRYRHLRDRQSARECTSEATVGPPRWTADNGFIVTESWIACGVPSRGDRPPPDRSPSARTGIGGSDGQHRVRRHRFHPDHSL